MKDQLENSLVAVPLCDLQELVASASARWLGVDAAASYSSLSAESIRRMLSGGDLTAYRPRKGKILIDRREFDAVILSSTARPRKGRGRSEGTRAARLRLAEVNGKN